MPGSVQPGGVDRDIDKLIQRVTALETKLRRRAPVDERLLPVLFSFAGPLEEDTESPALDTVRAVQYTLLRARVLTAPSGGPVTIELKRNGSLVRTLTIPDGDLVADDTDMLSLTADSYLTATVTAANDAADLSISALPKLA